jgi:hypothetical protein
LEFNTEFTEQPICTASYKYQKLKIAQLQSMELPEKEYQKKLTNVLDKECLCIGLSNAAAITYEKPFIKNLEAVTICPGPNVANFSKVVSLQTMEDHIYGRSNSMKNAHRPHMFVAELHLYINYLKEEIENDAEPDVKKEKYYAAFCQNLLNGISYYRKLAPISINNRQVFYDSLNEACSEVEAMLIKLNRTVRAI